MLEVAEAGAGFAPDGQRTLQIDRQVRHRLAESLETTLEACTGHLTWDAGKAGLLLSRLRAGPVRAGVMAIYADLVEAVFRDDLPAAQILLDDLFCVRPAPEATWKLCTLSDATLGSGQAARFHRIISDDPAITIRLSAYDDERLQAAKPVFDDAFRLIQAASPALAEELEVLLRDIVLVEGRTAQDAPAEIGGASTFYLWGAAFISFSWLPSRLALAAALVHEAAHLLLFGFSFGKPLVLNGLDERFDSPLRDDQRPMEGIVHAAYVVARLALLMRELRERGVLSAQETASAGAWAVRYRQDFAAALEIIKARARFTPIGEAAFAGAVEWMGRE